MKTVMYCSLLALLFWGVFFLESCDPTSDEDNTPCEDQTKNYYLDVEHKEMMPYNSYDTINMVNNTGDTIHCIGTGKKYFTTRYFQLYPDPSCGNHGTETLYEAYRIMFVDSVKNEQIEVEHYRRHTYNGHERIYDIVITFKDNTYLIMDYHISNPDVYDYVGDVTILNKLYTKVNRADLYQQDSLKFIYINKVSGILKIQLNPDEIWYLTN